MRDRLLAAEKVRAIDWRDGTLHLLDQRALPSAERWLACSDAASVAEAIRLGAVGGDAAVGISAAYGLVLALRQRLSAGGDWRDALEADFTLLAATRPAEWTLNRLRERLQRLKPDDDPSQLLEAEALAIHESDREANLNMAQAGMVLIRKYQGSEQAVLTHGNAGALASGGFGTALGVIRGAWLDGMIEHVCVDESRPSLLGTRLTAWELAADGIPVTVNADAAAAHLMKTKGITWVIVGAERIAANGDVLGRIGTYQLAVNAMHHGVRFMVVAPGSCIDLALDSGDDFPLEEDAGAQWLEGFDAGAGGEVEAFDPVFDVTPADLVDVIVTEKGVVERPDTAKLAQLLCRKRLH